MAKRPMITTGLALASAGLLVAALPVVAAPLSDRDIQVAAQVETDLSASVTDLFSGFDPAGLLEGFGLIDGLLGGGLDLDALAIDEGFLQRLNDAWWVGITVGGSDPTNPRGTVSGLTGVAMVITEQLAVTLAGAVGLDMNEDEIKSLVQGFYVGGPIVIGLLGFLVINDALGEPIPSDLVIGFFEGGITEVVRGALVGLTGGEESEFADHINAYFDGGIVGLLYTLTDGLFPEDDEEPETVNILASQEKKAPADEQFVVAENVPQVFQRFEDAPASGVAITETFTTSLPEDVPAGSVDEPLVTVPTDPPAAPPTNTPITPAEGQLDAQPTGTPSVPRDPPTDPPESAGLDMGGAEAGAEDDTDGQENATAPAKYEPPVIAGNSPAKEPNSNNWKKIFDRGGKPDQEAAPAE